MRVRSSSPVPKQLKILNPITINYTIQIQPRTNDILTSNKEYFMNGLSSENKFYMKPSETYTIVTQEDTQYYFIVQLSGLIQVYKLYIMKIK